MCGVARDTAGESDIVPPLEAAMPPSITLGSDPPKPATGPGDHPPPQEPLAKKDIPTIDLSCDENDDLQKAIALSLQDQQGTTTLQGVSAEDQEVSRALEASLKESQPQATIDLLNPQERKRQPGVPVGLKNIGNSCWFNVVIQPLFHIPVFRDLILNFSENGDVDEHMEESQKSSRQLVPALRKLFSLMIGSDRKYIDPTHAVNIFQGQDMRKNAQQDVCEFTHKLLERLEEEFQQLLRRQGVEKESSGCHVSKDADFDNPIMKLFYGQSKKLICDDDKGPKQETFGQYPLHVMKYEDIHDSILASMARCMPNTLGDIVEPVQQETWFKMLPPVLIFSLSRYEYSHEKKRAEKVHNKFEFPEFLYMDRYMEINKKNIKEKHIKVAKLRGELNSLTKTLDRYQKYGSGEAKYPIGDILKYTLDFAQTGLNPGQEAEANSVPSPSMMEVDGVESCENDVEMADAPEVKKGVEDSCTEKESKPSLVIKGDAAANDLILKEVQVENNITVKEESNNLSSNDREVDEEPQQMPSPSKRMRILPPAPRNITTSELSILQSCLSRWLQDINLQVAELRRCINELEQQLRQMYDEPCLKRIPYRLHAVVVHEGQASGGHYWVYTFDNSHKTWMKFNDIQVVESNWEELLQDSVGGQNNASAYCLLYIDESRYNTLFPEAPESIETMMSNVAIDLQEYVKNDNLAFMRELEEWDMKQEKSDQGKDASGVSQDQQSGGGSWDNSLQLVPVTAPNSPDIICVQDSDEASFFTEVHTMLSQTVYDALTKNDENALERDRETVLNSILFHEFVRLQRLADANADNTPYGEPSILDFGVYLIRNNENVESLLQWYGCEVVLHVAQNISERTPLVERVAVEAAQYLHQLRDQHQRTEGPEYRGWRLHYRTLIECAWHLVCGHRQYVKGNLERALPLLLRACHIHTELKERPPSGARKTLDRRVLWKYRRACLLALSEQLVETFLNGEEEQVGEIPGNVISLVVPALTQLCASSVEEDKATVDEVRAHWCQLLERELGSPAKSKMLEQILEGVLSGVGETKGILPLQISRPPAVLPLYKEYVEACNAIMTASSKPKAQTSDL